MEKLVLAKEGVFPVIKDAQGRRIDEQPKTGLLRPGTIQGEGKLAGVPSLFVRLSGCNLRCIWQMENGSFCRCDTTYASFHANDTLEMEVGDIFDWIRHNTNNLKHLVITGGEPLLQKKALAPLCRRLKEELGLHLTLESNGSLFDEEVAHWIDLFSISPKLRNSVPTTEKMTAYGLQEAGPYKYHDQRRVNTAALQSYIDLARSSNKDLQLKFVVGKSSDLEAIKDDFLNHLHNYKEEDILLMPLGAAREEIALSSPLVLDMAIANGWRFSPRVHIELFGSKSGV